MNYNDYDLDFLFQDILEEDITEISEIYSKIELHEIEKNINVFKSPVNGSDTTTDKEERNSTTFENVKQKKRLSPLVKSSSFNVKNEDSVDVDVDVLLGTVLSINEKDNEFEASLIDSNDENKISNANFSFEDVQYESDKKLISVGARFVWTIGKEKKILNVHGELKYGATVNVSKIRFRRTRVLNKKKQKQVEEDAEFWTKFFTGLDPKN